MASIQELLAQATGPSAGANSDTKGKALIALGPPINPLQEIIQCLYCYKYGHIEGECRRKKGERMSQQSLLINQLSNQVAELHNKIAEMEQKTSALLAWAQAKDDNDGDARSRKKVKENKTTPRVDGENKQKGPSNKKKGMKKENHLTGAD